MNKHLFNYIGRENLRREYKKQLRFLIIVTLGFTIAFTWRQTLFDISLSFVRFITTFNSSSAESIFASVIITVVSLILIYFTSHWLNNN